MLIFILFDVANLFLYIYNLYKEHKNNLLCHSVIPLLISVTTSSLVSFFPPLTAIEPPQCDQVPRVVY